MFLKTPAGINKRKKKTVWDLAEALLALLAFFFFISLTDLYDNKVTVQLKIPKLKYKSFFTLVWYSSIF